jgi:hypothetical protein
MPDESVGPTPLVGIDPLTATPPPAADRYRPWTGTSVMLRHRPDGTVSASSRGLSAVGATEAEALRQLAILVKTAARAAGNG